MCFCWSHCFSWMGLKQSFGTRSLLDWSQSKAERRGSHQEKEGLWGRHPHCPGTVGLHRSFTERPAWGNSTTSGAKVNPPRFPKLGQTVGTWAFPEASIWRTLELKSSSLIHFTSQARPLPLFPQWGNFPGSRLGLVAFLEVLIGTLLWTASNLPGVWLEAIGEALTEQTLPGVWGSLLKRPINLLWRLLHLHFGLFVGQRAVSVPFLTFSVSTHDPKCRSSALRVRPWKALRSVNLMRWALRAQRRHVCHSSHQTERHWGLVFLQLLLHPASPALPFSADAPAFPLLTFVQCLERKESGGTACWCRNPGRAGARAALCQWPSESFKGSGEGATENSRGSPLVAWNIQRLGSLAASPGSLCCSIFIHVLAGWPWPHGTQLKWSKWKYFMKAIQMFGFITWLYLRTQWKFPRYKVCCLPIHPCNQPPPWSGLVRMPVDPYWETIPCLALSCSKLFF